MPSEEQMARLVEQLQQAPGLAEQLPMEQATLVRAALNGESVHDIANANRVTEATVWEVLGNAARMATGQAPAQRSETGGLGSDTDPGVTGGYGDTGFGSLGIDGPGMPNPDEP
jgi:hypothetical protein